MATVRRPPANVAPSIGDRGGGTLHLGGPASIEIVGPVAGSYTCSSTAPPAASVGMAQFDEAWDDSGASADVAPRFRDRAEEAYAGRDAHRFYIRVRDPGARGSTVQVSWRTLWDRAGAPGNPHDDPPSSALTLARIAPGVFVSPGIAVVSTPEDRASHQDPDGRMIQHGMPEYRVRWGSLFGFVEATYAGAATPARVPVFLASERRTATLELFSVNAEGASAEIVSAEIARLRLLYARYGIWIGVDQPVRRPAATVTRHPNAWPDPQAAAPRVPQGIADPFGIVPDYGDPRIGFEQWMNKMARLYGDPRHVRVFFVDEWEPNSTVRGYSYVPSHLAYHRAHGVPPPTDETGADLDAVNGSIFLNQARTPYTFAHELAHVLCDTDPDVNAGHYPTIYRSGDDDPATPPEHETRYALLNPATSSAVSHLATCRIWPSELRHIMQSRHVTS